MFWIVFRLGLPHLVLNLSRMDSRSSFVPLALYAWTFWTVEIRGGFFPPDDYSSLLILMNI